MAPMTDCGVTGIDVLSIHTPACLRPRAGTGVAAVGGISVGIRQAVSLLDSRAMGCGLAM